MSRDLNAINETDVQQTLTRAFGLRDRVPVPTLAPELQAVALVSDLTQSPPFDKKRIAAAGTTITSGGAAVATLQFRNPADSGVVARLQVIWMSSSLSQDLFMTIGPLIAGATVGPGVWMNTGLPGIPVCHLAAGSSRVTGIFWRSASLAQRFPVVHENPIIVTPGFSVQVETIALASTIQVSCYWEEFPETPTR